MLPEITFLLCRNCKLVVYAFLRLHHFVFLPFVVVSSLTVFVFFHLLFRRLSAAFTTPSVRPVWFHAFCPPDSSVYEKPKRLLAMTFASEWYSDLICTRGSWSILQLCIYACVKVIFNVFFLLSAPLLFPQMHHPIQMKPADSEKSNGEWPQGHHSSHTHMHQ